MLSGDNVMELWETACAAVSQTSLPPFIFISLSVTFVLYCVFVELHIRVMAVQL